MASFAAGLAEHLDALQARDIERFAATVAEDAAVVDGAGRIVRGRDQVVRSHRDWFASADAWTFAYAIRMSRDLGGAGFALLEVTYRNTPDGAASHFLLSLVFERASNGAWLLAFDQNTPLSIEEPTLAHRS